MSNRGFSSQMARSAQCDKVARFVGDLHEEMSASPVYVMDIKRAPVTARRLSAASAYFISVKDSKSHAAPMGAKVKTFAASIIGMLSSDYRSLSAKVRTEAPSSLGLAGKGSKGFIAMLAGQLFGRDQTLIAASPRAMPNLGVALPVKECAAYRTWNSLHGARQPIGSLAGFAAKSQKRVLLHDMPRPLEVEAAVSASKCRSIDHRCGMAFLAAEDCRRVISLELFATMGARLEHS